MPQELKNANTVVGGNTVDPYTAINVTVNGIGYTIGPGMKMTCADDGIASMITAGNAKAAQTTSADQDARTVQT